MVLAHMLLRKAGVDDHSLVGGLLSSRAVGGVELLRDGGLYGGGQDWGGRKFGQNRHGVRVETVADEQLDLVPGIAEDGDSLLVGGAQQGLAVDLDDPLAHPDQTVLGSSRARVHFDTEDTFVGRVEGVSRLAPQTTFDDHAELLAGLLHDGDLPEAGRQGVVLDGELHDLAVLQEGHDGLLVCDHPDVGGVDGQHPVAHLQLVRGSGGSSGDDFTDVDSLGVRRHEF